MRTEPPRARVLLARAIAALALAATPCLAADEGLLLHAPLDGDASAITPAGIVEGQLLPGARFVPGRGGKGLALVSSIENPLPDSPRFPLDFFGPGAIGADALASASTSPTEDLAKLGERPAGTETFAARLPLPEHDAGAGTISFWFQPQVPLGRSVGWTFPLLEGTGGAGPSVAYGSTRGEVVLRPSAWPAGLNPDDATCTFKHLKAGKWHHFAFSWDAATGTMEARLFGEVIADGQLPPGDAPAAARELLVGCNPIAIDDLRVHDRALSRDEILALAQLHEGDALGDAHIVAPTEAVDFEALRGELLLRETFDDPAALDGWTMEGPGDASIVDGALRLATTATGEGQFLGHLVFWNNKDLPADFIAEWDFTPTQASGLCIVFFGARGRGGEDLMDPALPPRDASFIQYYGGAIDAYQVSHFRNSGGAAPEAILRRHHGFHLLAMGPDHTPRVAGQTSRVTLIKRGGRVQFLVNGQACLDHVDDGSLGPPLGAGKLGWRQMGLTGPCLYDNFTVHAVREPVALAPPPGPSDAPSLFTGSNAVRDSIGRERQITRASTGHLLTNASCWSPDGEWIVFDTRADKAGEVFDGATIEAVHVRTGEVRVLHESRDGARCGVPTHSPVDNRVVFIEGPEHPTPDWSYGPFHRRGVIVDRDKPGEARVLDARDIVPPFTPGALRGGSHVHVFSPDGQWVSFTYEDHVLAQLPDDGGDHDLNLRTIGVSVPEGPVRVPRTHPRNHDADFFSVVVARVIARPRPGSDEIKKACEEGWLGNEGYLRADGTRQRRALAFQGTVVSPAGEDVVEVFVVDFPDDVSVPGDGPLCGTPTRAPFPPRGCVQRRVTFTTDRPFPGIQGPRHWLRSSPDGARIAFLMKDDGGVAQLWTVSPNGGEPAQLTRNAWPIASCFTWSPDGRRIAHVMDGSVCVTDARTGETTRLTPRDESDSAPRPEACIFSPDGRSIAFVRHVEGWNQVFVVEM